MKKSKYLLFILFTFLSLLCFDNVYANSCDDYSNLCTKKTYKFSKDGNVNDFSITIGIVHFKQINSEAQNEQYIISYDNCGYCSEGQSCMKYCTSDPYRFNSNYNNVSIPVSSSTQKFPIAICAIPYNNSKPLNTYVDDSNVSNYVYFNETEVTNAINNGKCTRSNVYYSDKASVGCKDKKHVYSFTATTNMTESYISTSSTSAGVNICSVTMKSGETSKFYSHISHPYLCVPENYNISCNYINSTRYDCSLYTCNNNTGSGSSTKDEPVGNKCIMRNINNSSDTIQLNFTYDDDKVGAHLNAIEKNGVVVKDTLILGNEEYAESGGCPAYVYYYEYASSPTNYAYKPISSEEEKQTYDKNNSDVKVVKKYKLESSADISDLYEDELYDVEYSDKYGGSINWGDPIEKNCEGIIGEEALDFINEIFRWIQIIAPIFVIIIGGVEFGGAVLQDDKDALKKASSKLIKRLIIAVALFFVPMILSFVLDLFNEASGAFSSTCGIGE